MYTSIEIKGFRCFKHLTIPKLARINLIGGKNNTGKTALLEAIWVLAEGWATPEQTVRDLYRFRGLDEAAMKALQFEDVLTGFSQTGEGSIAAFDTAWEHPVLPETGWANVLVQASVTRGEASPAEAFGASVPAQLLTMFDRSRHTPGYLFLADDGRVLSRADEDARPTPCAMLPAGEHLPLDTVKDLFTTVQVGKLEAHLLAALAKVDGRVRDVVMVPRGEAWLLHCDLGGDRRVPLPLVGEGMSRACVVMLALCNARKGVALVDEIENGLHYSVLPDVWRAIAQAAEDLDVQVFATTHSHECVEAAAEAIPEGELLYHRLDRVDDEIECQTYSPRGLEIAIQTGNEVR